MSDLIEIVDNPKPTSKALADQINIVIQSNTFNGNESLLPSLIPFMESVRPGSLKEITELGLEEVRLSQSRFRSGTRNLNIKFYLEMFSLIICLGLGTYSVVVGSSVSAVISLIGAISLMHKNIKSPQDKK